MVYMIIPTTNVICVLFDPVVPTSSFNFIVFFLFLSLFFVNDIAYCPMICMIEHNDILCDDRAEVHVRDSYELCHVIVINNNCHVHVHARVRCRCFGVAVALWSSFFMILKTDNNNKYYCT